MNRRTLGFPNIVTVIIPAIEPTPNPATPNQVALTQWLILSIDE
jgi:hypothetical protein